MYILYEAYQRINNPPQIQSGAMLVVAALGLVINLISMRLLAGDKDKSLNVKGAYLEVWSDMLGSVGVIAGAIIIRVTDLGLGGLSHRSSHWLVGTSTYLDSAQGKSECFA